MLLPNYLLAFHPFFSALSAIVGVIAGFYIYAATKNLELSIGIWYFSIIEILQTISFFYLSSTLESQMDGVCGGSNSVKYAHEMMCDTLENKLLTLLSFLHVCFQPYFYHSINASLTHRCRYKG